MEASTALCEQDMFAWPEQGDEKKKLKVENSKLHAVFRIVNNSATAWFWCILGSTWSDRLGQFAGWFFLFYVQSSFG
jgi:hypothetical protein